MKSSKTGKSLIRKWQKILGLNNFKIFDIQVKPEELDCDAEVVCRNLSFTEFNLLLTMRDKNTIIHELLHILLWDYTDVAESIVKVSNLNRAKEEELLSKLGDKEHEVIEKLINALEAL